VALATQPVVLRHRPDTVVVWLDAHGDINTPSDTSSGYLGGMALSGPLGWWDSGLGAGLPEPQAILVGARDLDPAETAHIDAGRVTLVGPGAQIGDRLAEAIGGRPVYLHLDCDVLEPGLFTTDYSVPNGLTLADLYDCATAAALGEVAGVEVGEYEGDGTATVEDLVRALAPLLET
jgi:arginase